MEIKELRVNNIVIATLCDGSKKELPIKRIEEFGKNEIMETQGGWNDIEPIPLTEEWLIKFGFEWNEELRSFEKKGFRWLAKSVEMNASYQLWDNINRCMLSNQMYWHVHQLQNLYFALTGEELTIK